MATINADIREIRQTVYGRDMREPIADAIEHIRKLLPSDAISSREPAVERIESFVDEGILISYQLIPHEKWYTYEYTDVELRDTGFSGDKNAEIVSTGITVSSLGDDKYLATDAIGRDSTSLVSGDDNLWAIPNPIKKTDIHYGEDWTLILKRRND